MVLALLAGRKTMTRRIVKGGFDPNEYRNVKMLSHDQYGDQAFFFNDERPLMGIAPKYQIGDIMYVREGFFKGDSSLLDDPSIDYYIFKDGSQIYSTGEYCQSKQIPTPESTKNTRWKPSIHMPTVASRIWLECTDVKVEQVKGITEEDAIAEGVEVNRDGSYHDYLEPIRLWQDTAKASFQSLWLLINGRESWDANVWVFCYSFKVLSITGKPENI